MASYSFDEETLSNAAGVDPWKKYRQLKSGDPAAIDTLAAAFYKASGHLSEAHTAMSTSQRYVKQGYTTAGSSPLDTSAEASRLVKDPHIGSAHTAQIAKILTGVGSDLDTATVNAGNEVTTLDTRVAALLKRYEQLVFIAVHTGEARDDPSGIDSAEKEIFDEAVTATKTHGAAVTKFLTGYESSLHSALRSMADLGYVPPDGTDEGPGGVNLNAGSQDAAATVAAAKNGDTTGLHRSAFALSIINDAIAHDGGHVDDQEYDYLYSYYNGTAKHSDVIDHAIKGDPSLRHSFGSAYGDGLLNLSRGAEQTDDEGVGPNVHVTFGVGTYGRGGYNGLPPNVLDVLNSHLGQKAPTPDGSSTSSTGGPDILRAVYVHGHWVVKNYANATGFGDLLSYADKNVAGSTDFSTHLATTAITWKHDLDTISKNTAAWGGLDYTGLPGEDNFGQLGPHSPDPGNLPFTDAGSSGLLSAAAHNQTASAEVLLDAGDRHAILGLPWHGSGAADLINSGTAPDTGTHPRIADPNHPGTSLLNEAALAVVKDAGSHYQNFASIESTPVKNALTQLALTHLASFGNTTGSGAGSSIGTIEVPGGHVQGLSLNNTDAANYLKLIALSGPKYSGIVHAGALQLGSEWLQHGDGATGHGSAADHTATLIGRVSSSEYAAALDKASHLSGTAQQAYIGEIREQQQEAQHDALQNGVLDTIGTVVDVGTLGAGEDIKGAAEGFGKFLETYRTAADDYQGYNDAGQNTPEQNRLIELGSQVQQAIQQPASNAQLHTTVTSDLNYAALRASGYAHPEVAYSGDANTINHVVDPALNKYYGHDDAENGYANTAVNTMNPDPALDPQHPTVDWNDPTVRRQIFGGSNEVYDSPLAKNSITIVRELEDVTPK